MKYREEISRRIIQQSTSIIQSLKIMDVEKIKLLFVFEKLLFLGIITIGDIQRAIIKNIPLNSPVSNFLDKQKIYAHQEDTFESIKEEMLRLRAECMPILDNNGQLIDVYFWEDLFESPHENNHEKIHLPVVIMAGGLGTRLRPLTNVIPKALIPINEKTIIEMIMDQFMLIGCNNFFLSVNYKVELLQYYLSNLPVPYNIELIKEEKPLGTIGSVSLLKGKINTPFFVSNCDILIDQDYREVFDYHTKNNNDITIVIAVKSYKIPYGVIETGENGLMSGLSEKPDITYMINTGVYILQPELINEIPEEKFFHITQLIEKVKAKNGKIGCFPVSEKSWTDIGDWNEYLMLINKKNYDRKTPC